MKAAAAAASGTTTAAAVIRRSRPTLSADPAVRNLLRTGSAPTNTVVTASATPLPSSAQCTSGSVSAAAAAPTVTGPCDENYARLTRCRSVSSATRVRAVTLPPRCRGGFGANPCVQGAGARAVASSAPVDDTRRVGAAAAAAVAFAIATAQRENEAGKENGGVAGSRVWCHRAEGVPGEAFDVEEVLVANKIQNNAEYGSSETVSDTYSSSDSSSSSGDGGSGGAGSRVICDNRRNDDNNKRQQRAAVVANSPSHHHHHQRDNSGDASRFLGLGLEQLNLPRAAGDFPTAVGIADTSLLPSSKQLRITDCYRFEGGGQLVGRGHRSTVSSATHRRTGQVVAVKRISRAVSSRREVLEEVNMLKLAGAHPNVVTMQAFFEDKEAYYIVMDLCQGGELYHRLADKGRYSEGQAARIMAEVAEAVGYLHNNGIVHFDLKPENIMLAVGDDCVPEVRLADFGSAFRQHRPLSGAKDCTVAYSAPEVLACQDVDEKVDMWALGVVMWVLLTGRHPFDTDVDMSEEEVAYRVTHEEPDLRSRGIRHVSPEGKDLVRRLLAKDPEDRPSARQMLAHPWLRAVRSRNRRPLRQAAGHGAIASRTAAMPVTAAGDSGAKSAAPIRPARQGVAEAAAGAAAAAAVASVTGGGAFST